MGDYPVVVPVMNPYGTLRLYGDPPESLDGLRLAWQDRALCAEVPGDWWYPEKGGSSMPARSVCAGCPVRRECLTDALRRPGTAAAGGYGIWGGTSPEQREHLLRRFRGNVTAAADFAMRQDCTVASPDRQPREDVSDAA